MAIMDTLGLGNLNYWQFLGHIIMILFIITIVLIALIIATFIVLALMFDRKAIIFPAYGDPSFIIKEEKKQDNEGNEILDAKGKPIIIKSIQNKDGLVMGIPYIKKCRLSITTEITKIQLMLPFVFTNPISHEMIYPEGVYLVRIGNQYIPIRKPGVDAEQGYLVKLGNWQSFKEANFLAFKQKRQKYADKDEKIKIFAMFLVAMLLTMIIVGFVSWYILKTVGSIHTDFANLAGVIQGAAASLAGPVPG